MAQEPEKDINSEQNRIDEVGRSAVYPVSEMEGASDDAVVHSGASLGQGERGAEGYRDAGTSEIFYIEGENEEAGQGGDNDRQ